MHCQCRSSSSSSGIIPSRRRYNTVCTSEQRAAQYARPLLHCPLDHTWTGHRVIPCTCSAWTVSTAHCISLSAATSHRRPILLYTHRHSCIKRHFASSVSDQTSAAALLLNDRRPSAASHILRLQLMSTIPMNSCAISGRRLRVLGLAAYSRETRVKLRVEDTRN